MAHEGVMPDPEIPTAPQLRTLLEALQRGERLTVADALVRYGVYALSQRIGELRDRGWPVQRQMRETDGGARVAEYRLR